MTLVALPNLRVFGTAVCDVLAMALPRDLDVVELWAGKKAATFAAMREGLNCQTVEREDGPGQDLTTEEGFWAAARAIMRLRIGGLLIMAPVCSSFVFANSVMTRRTNAAPEGDGTYGPVKDGNFMALVAAFFFIVASHRETYVFWENPLNSFMWKQPCVISAWDYVISCRCTRRADKQKGVVAGARRRAGCVSSRGLAKEASLHALHTGPRLQAGGLVCARCGAYWYVPLLPILQ